VKVKPNQSRLRNDDWKANLESRLTSRAAPAAKDANSQVLDVELDLRNRRLRVNTAEQLPLGVKKVIRRQVLAAIEKEFRTAGKGYESLRVDIRRPHSYPYTMHSVPVLGTPRQFNSSQKVCELSIKIAELNSLRAAYEQLRTRAKESDYVATCARGGLPAINYIAAPEHTTPQQVDSEQQINDGAELSRLRDKYNVFPGLNWKNPTIAGKKSLAHWLDGLRPGTSLLFFDTGSKGNGARRFFNFIVKTYVPNASRLAISKFTVLGVVDERTTDQKEETFELVSSSGETSVITINYIHVDWVFTEDVALLLGYDLLVREELLQPVRGNVCAHLVDENGLSKITLGTNMASAVLNRWLKSEPPVLAKTQPAQAQSTDTSSLVVDFVRANAYDLEKAEILAAAACGLIDQEEALHLLKGAHKKLNCAIAKATRMANLISKKPKARST
jgi:hypothetical protein